MSMIVKNQVKHSTEKAFVIYRLWKGFTNKLRTNQGNYDGFLQYIKRAEKLLL